MASNFTLDGAMIPRNAQRSADHRDEERIDAQSQTAVMEYRGRRHVIRLVNISRSGAMVIFSLIPHIGEPIKLQLIGQGLVDGQVRWVRDGRIGVSFSAPLA
ncbi:PilZ domain-containing protein [Sphingomonas sinipercae]|uniref:PilZ domain-containing protein n=1 Tax=Sphingomonas sinipercae TaxID=2714944 RepID=A0A6G7ZQJ7_9SPHN|nr:PilZ domain-containing protein [Sphingomonas sinipercae]QIL03213.1 PilZ domain-containing protein [Sphingomonas sinipercae]